MNMANLPMDFKDEELKKELRRFDSLEILKNELTVFELLMLNDIITNYEKFTNINTDDGVYKIYNYSNLERKYDEYFKIKNLSSKTKNKLISKGFIKVKQGQFHCEKLGYCKISIKLAKEKINSILY